jgi:probable HAF family extracellular repeat protein
MIINNCFKTRSFILTAILIASAGLANPASAQETRSFLVDLNSKTVTAIGALSGTYNEVHALNNAGQVVGRSRTAEDPYSPIHAFITGPNGMGMRDLGTLGGRFSEAYDINDAGQVVGYSDTAEGDSHVFITGPNGMGMRDLGISQDYHHSFGINNTGQVIGNSGTAAFITGPNGMGMRELGTLWGYSEAYGINNAGQVVGYFENSERETLRLAGNFGY